MDRNVCSSEQEVEVRKGPWTMEEDLVLINYIANHGEGVWNSLARSAGLKRTGKSCRLRWLNYLRPDVRRGNITAQEQLIIMELHAKWGNRWSKIAKQLPGRTDNEIKNYWRTRIQKHMKQPHQNCTTSSGTNICNFMNSDDTLINHMINYNDEATTTTTHIHHNIHHMSPSSPPPPPHHHQPLDHINTTYDYHYHSPPANLQPLTTFPPPPQPNLNIMWSIDDFWSIQMLNAHH